MRERPTKQGTCHAEGKRRLVGTRSSCLAYPTNIWCGIKAQGWYQSSVSMQSRSFYGRTNLFQLTIAIITFGLLMYLVVFDWFLNTIFFPWALAGMLTSPRDPKISRSKQVWQSLQNLLDTRGSRSSAHSQPWSLGDPRFLRNMGIQYYLASQQHVNSSRLGNS